MAGMKSCAAGMSFLLSAPQVSCFSATGSLSTATQKAPDATKIAAATKTHASAKGHLATPTTACATAMGVAGVAVVAASAPKRKQRSNVSSALISCHAFENEIGACDPLLFWDPIGFCDDCTKEDFDRRRAVELKHGRLSMLACLGMLWPDVFGKFDGYLSPSSGLKFTDIPSGIDAIYKVPVNGWAQILLLAGLIETKLLGDQSFGGFGYAKYGAEPGNFGTGYWGRKIKDPAERRLKLTTELNNGRLAMIAITGMLVQNGLTGQSPIEQWQSGHISPFNDGQGFFALPRRAQFDASKELGACPPLGYWDPFGMMAFQDEAKFRRNRELELKHGRICMAATIGMVVPDIFGKFPGYLAPSSALKFSDIPTTIDAIYKVPVEGWLQIFAFAGAIEARNLFFPSDYGYPPFFFTKQNLDAETKQRKLLAEINNGRLAMVAMAAFVAQNNATGESIVDQFAKGDLNPFIGGYARPACINSTALRAVSNASASLPWAPLPEGLSNDAFGEYVGDVGFDPLGFAKNKRLLPWYREAELAHGRVCMLATLGFTIQSAGVKIEPFVTRYPTSSEDALLAATQVPVVGWLQILAVIALSELWRYENVISKYDTGVKPGDLGWNPTAPISGPRPKWFGPTFTAAYSPEEFNNLRLREIKHARLAMFSFAFMVVENAISGRTPSLFFLTPDKPEYATAVGDFIPKNL